jgi:alpha-glucuronidase
VPGRDAEDEFAGRDLEEAVEAAGLADRKDIEAAYRVELLRSGSAQAKAVLARLGLAFDVAMQDEGYVLSVEPHETFVIAASGTGIFYGVQTLKQMLPLAGGTSRLCPSRKPSANPLKALKVIAHLLTGVPANRSSSAEWKARATQPA